MSRVPPVGPLPGGPWTNVRGARDGASRRACRGPRTSMARGILGKSLTASFRACLACVAPRSMAFREACARDVTGTRPDFRMLILFRAHLNVGFKLCVFQSEGSVKRFSLTHFACRCLSIHLSKYNANIHCTSEVDADLVELLPDRVGDHVPYLSQRAAQLRVPTLRRAAHGLGEPSDDALRLRVTLRRRLRRPHDLVPDAREEARGESPH